MYIESGWRVLKNKVTPILFESEVYRDLKEIADYNCISLSELVNYMLRFAIDHRESWEG